MTEYRQSLIKDNLHLRARIIQSIRRFFIDGDYLEIDTPIRIPAPAPEAHIDAVATDGQYLQTSPELCMKQLLAAGFPCIFQICKCFRQDERGRKHLPELTMLEWYLAGGNYLGLMDQPFQGSTFTFFYLQLAWQLKHEAFWDPFCALRPVS